MTLVRQRLDIAITVQSPFLFKSGAPSSYGLDALALRDASGRPLLPADQVRGVLAHAVRKLVKVEAFTERDFITLFGSTSTNLDDPKNGVDQATRFQPLRSRLDVTDLAADGEPTDAGTFSSVRVAIDEHTGAAKSGHLMMVELVSPIGETVTFTGQAHLVWEPGDLAGLVDRLDRAAQLIFAIGAMKSAGFGTVCAARIVPAGQPADLTLPRPKSQQTASDTVRIAFIADRPLLVGDGGIVGNLIGSRSIIPGSVLKGALARQLALHRGRDDGILEEDNALGAALAAMTIGHAFPHLTRSKRTDGDLPDPSDDAGKRCIAPRSLAEPVPLSIAKRGKHIADFALLGKDQSEEEGIPAAIGLINGAAPVFRPDWKPSDDGEIADALLGADSGRPETEIRTHTKIVEGTQIADESQLFTTVLVRPDFEAVPDKGETDDRCRTSRLPLAWIADIARGEADASAYAALLGGLTGSLHGVGRTGAILTGHALDPPPVHVAPTEGELWVIVLRTPVIACTVDDLEDATILFRAYATWLDTASAGALSLVRFFAQQTLIGGYLAVRYPETPGGGYRPYVQTAAGSVFVLKSAAASGHSAATVMGDWLRFGLPACAQYARRSWREFPFRREEGFGAIRLQSQHSLLKSDAVTVVTPVGRLFKVQEAGYVR